MTFEVVGADGTSTYSAPTGPDGIAAVTFTADRVPGSYSVTARYAGDEDHLGSADVEAFTIEKEDARLVLEVVGKGSNRALQARLSDADSGEGIVDRSVSFASDGEDLGTRLTSSNGVARMDLPAKDRNGHHDYEANFGGDDYYLEATDRRQT